MNKFFAFLLYLLCPSLNAANTIINIGFAAPLTGSQAHYGQDMQNGIILALEDVNNSHPKIAQHPVKFVLQIEDDQADPKTAVLIAHRFVSQNVKGILGHFNSGTSIAAASVYHRAQIPQIAMATSPEYTQLGFNNTFRMLGSDVQQAQVLARFMIQKAYRRLAIIDDRTAYGSGLANALAQHFTQEGGKVIRREFSSDKTMDFRPILLNIKRVKPQIQAIFFAGTDFSAAMLAKQMRELRINAVLLAGDMVCTAKFIELAGKRAESVLASAYGSPLAAMPQGLQYQKRYVQRFQKDVGPYALYAYDASLRLLQAMLRANSSDPKKYLPILKTITINGVTGLHSGYDAQGNLLNPVMTIYQVINKQWHKVETTHEVSPTK